MDYANHCISLSCGGARLVYLSDSVWSLFSPLRLLPSPLDSLDLTLTPFLSLALACLVHRTLFQVSFYRSAPVVVSSSHPPFTPLHQRLHHSSPPHWLVWLAPTLLQVVFGRSSPLFASSPPAFTPFNQRLDHSQLAAVSKALAARHVALIHGPPGTGKTTAVVEVRGEPEAF